MKLQKSMHRMVSKFFLCIICFCLSIEWGGKVSAQSMQQIKNDASFLWAEATAESVEAADEKAVADLIQGLAQWVSIHENPTVNLTLMRGYLSEVKLFSGFLSQPKQKNAVVLRFLKKEQIGGLFEKRRLKIRQMLALAESAEQKLQMDVALRNYTWSEMLIHSLPLSDQADLTYKNRIGKLVSVKLWVDQKIEEILSGLKVTYHVEQARENSWVEVSFTYRGKPVRNIDYRFFDGVKWSGIYTAKDGRGVIERVASANVDHFKVKYESESSYMMHIDQEVKSIQEALAEKAVVKPQREVLAVDTLETVDVKEVTNKILDVLSKAEESSNVIDSSLFQVSCLLDTSPYEAVVNQVCDAIASKNVQPDESLFTPEGYEVYKRLIRYGNARLLNPGELYYYGLGDEVYCRSIPMVFSFAGNTKTFVEDVVFTFNKEKKISNISFALHKEAAKDIVEHENWPEEVRIILVSFLENYKTAYALKRLDYISSIFDDEALIITGRVLNNVKMDEEFGDNRYVILTKSNKRQYMNRLKTVFQSQEYINIGFSNCDVLRMGKENHFFGIQICQDYHSSSYSDFGYLFLMVDLKDYRKPIIHVRTWQTSPDKEFGIIGPYHF